MERSPMLMDQIGKMASYEKQFSAILIKIPTQFFTEIEKTIFTSGLRELYGRGGRKIVRASRDKRHQRNCLLDLIGQTDLRRLAACIGPILKLRWSPSLERGSGHKPPSLF